MHDNQGFVETQLSARAKSNYKPSGGVAKASIASAVSSLPLFQIQPDAVLGASDQLVINFLLVPSVCRANVVLPQERRNDALLLQEGELLPDAVARSGTEGNVRERVSAFRVFRQETVRVEFFRVREESVGNMVEMNGVSL